MKSTIDITYRAAKRIVLTVLGGTVLLLGIVMVITPGPAFILIPLGLGLLGIEYAWARNWLRKIRRHLSDRLAKNRGDKADERRNL